MQTMIPKILVVDDEPDLEILIKQKFRKEIKENKYNFTFACNGVDALEILNENKGIELVLTDINMPEMDGLTLLSKIKELNNPLLHSVIVSAYGDILNIRTAMNGGAFDFVVKPIDFKDLEITIKKAVDNLASLKKALLAREELVTVRKELEEARTLQLSMLPKSIPQNGKLDIAVYMHTASEVGGDYYDFTVKTDGSLNVAIGDATGHGMKAGIMVSIMKTLFISDSSELEMVDFFNNSNATIKALNLGRMLMAYSMLNIKGNSVTYLNAGIPSLYKFDSSTKKVIEIESNNLPLGAFTETNYFIKNFDIQPGDVLLLLSDGFPELINDSNEVLGYERVAEILDGKSLNSPEEIIEEFKNISSEWINGSEPPDDITFVVIKVK